MKIPTLFAVAIVAAFVLGGMFNSTTTIIMKEPSLTRIITAEDPLTAEISVPAVDSQNNGVISDITVSVEQGSGRVLASIENILFFVDTQNSLRTAKNVAEDITRIDLSHNDIVFSIEADATVIEGPSAGAALTIATIAALEGKELNKEVMITGSVLPDGTIGRVGKLKEKAGAARDHGAKVLLVPEQGEFYSATKDYDYEREVTCEATEWGEFCRTEYIKKLTNGGELGIDVVEVGTIKEALQYFIDDYEKA